MNCPTCDCLSVTVNIPECFSGILTIYDSGLAQGDPATVVFEKPGGAKLIYETTTIAGPAATPLVSILFSDAVIADFIDFFKEASGLIKMYIIDPLTGVIATMTDANSAETDCIFLKFVSEIPDDPSEITLVFVP